jgi:hypothetical protein
VQKQIDIFLASDFLFIDVNDLEYCLIGNLAVIILRCKPGRREKVYQ